MPKKVPVSERAILQRTRRKLLKDGQQLLKHRGTELYFLIDSQCCIVASWIVLGDLARKLKTIWEWEEIKPITT